MKTPAGIECRYFYGDYYRGKNKEECRLIGNVPPPANWTPDLCINCPIPAITLANACPNMVLNAKVKRKLGILKRYVKISAYCKKTNQIVEKPEIGCGECHPVPDFFNTEGK